MCVAGSRLQYLSEPVEEGFGESLSPPSLDEGVLAAEDLGLLVLHLEGHPQLWNIDL